MEPTVFAADSVQTLTEFEGDALRVAEVLRERGVALGTRVILKADNSAAYLKTLFALLHVGASVVLADQQEHVADTRAVAAQSGAKLLLVDDDAPVAEDLAPVRLYELLVDAAGLAGADGRLDFDDWAALPDGLIMRTSGSTGTPKCVVKSGGAFLRNLERNAAQVGHVGDDVLLPLLPFAHQYGLSMVLIAWQVRCSLVIAPYRRLDQALRMAGDAGVTVIDATPASYRSMLNLATRRAALRAGLDGARMFCVGAAPLDASLVGGYVAEFGRPLLDSYGSTELGNVAFATIDNPVECGRAMPGIGVRVVDDLGRPLPAGEAGEIEVDTPDGLTGHLADDGALLPAPGGWARTGDLGRLDADGNLSVLGRKHAVHRMGYTLYPDLIERRVADAGHRVRVVALPDQRAGVTLTFFVEDEAGNDAQHWRDALHGLLPAYERPNRVAVLERFPLNRNGKVDKLQLRKLAAEAEAVPAAAGR
ncbi:class I adenylate-forming enzyme family protein [Actinoplanes sp. NPDC049118]|uniref:class I adenylate-forming enzyme family protein n=1 Tax=Actinoplanes sp. NPDC049118 TaxID=3155769 RepID=UPI0033FE54A2